MFPEQLQPELYYGDHPLDAPGRRKRGQEQPGGRMGSVMQLIEEQ
jgi:hypothetical protein